RGGMGAAAAVGGGAGLTAVDGNCPAGNVLFSGPGNALFSDPEMPFFCPESVLLSSLEMPFFRLKNALFSDPEAPFFRPENVLFSSLETPFFRSENVLSFNPFSQPSHDLSPEALSHEQNHPWPAFLRSW
ncbi:MAG: hypothetical protein MPL62_17750, partial [Alphaproteobacteria bacterium]|nr:hypothetical protein [Gammaproteobacteria bacterium]MDA8003131.1 hypothetical protein [Alphaproteobacteria bacterium]MDA8010645.1 hypothetical protein [Alphaproteobacteria bacterium]